MSEKENLTLGIDNINYYRRVEFWKIYNRAKTKEYGTFLVKWLNSIYTKEELSIDLRGGLKKTKFSGDELNKIIVYLKQEFENRLLNSEDEDHEIRLDLTQSRPVPSGIPSIFEKQRDGKESILDYFTKMGKLNRFYEKKLFFRYRGDDRKELDYFLELYKGMKVYTVCILSFLQNLKNNDNLEHLIF